MLHAALALLLAASAVAPDPLESVPVSMRVDPSGAPLDAKLRDRLDGGEILVALIDVKGDPVKGGVAMAVIDVEPAVLFAAITDYEHHADFMPYVAKSEVSSRTTDHVTLHQYLEFPLGIGDRDYQLTNTLETKEVDGVPVLWAHWVYDDIGNIKATHGGWELMPWGSGRTLLRYTVFSDPGGSFPDWMKNMATKTAMPRVIKALRKRVKAK